MSKLSIILIIIFTLIAIFFLKSLGSIIKIIRNYRKLGHKEFMSRFKEGFEKITPAQRTRAELNGLIVILIGILTGLVVTPIVRVYGVWYWVEIILSGSLIITGFQLLGKWSLYKVQKKQDEIMKQLQGNKSKRKKNENK